MMDSPTRPETPHHTQRDFHRRPIWLGFGLSLGFTLVFGLLLTVIFDNAWWLAWSGFAGLFLSGIVVAALAGTGNLVRGAIVALLYFATVAVIYLVGQAAEFWLPSLPSLPHHTSTYLFFWPLALILAGTLRLLVGGLHKEFDTGRRLALLRLVPIFTALSVIILATFRPTPLASSRSEWQQPSPVVEGSTLNEFMVTPLAGDETGGLWFAYKKLAGRGGMGHFVPGASGQNRWQFYPGQTDSGKPRFDFVLSLLPNGRQGIWVSSLKGGLSYYDAQTATWQAITALNSDVLAMITNGGNLWLATFGDGVVCYNPMSEHWKTFTRASTAGGLQDNEIIALIADGNGGLWAGTYGGGVSHYDSDQDTWEAFTVVSTGGGLGSDDVRTLAVDEAGNLWAGTFGGGISRYKPHLDTWEMFTTETTAGNLASDYVLTLLPGENGELWAGLSNLRDQGGLAYFDGKRWQSYTVASTEGRLLSNDVRALAADGAGGLWIGTRGGGLSHLAADHQTWTAFTVKSTGAGLAGDTVLALLPDGVGKVWIGTGSGLSYLRWNGP